MDYNGKSIDIDALALKPMARDAKVDIWQMTAKAVLRIEMVRRGLSYADLAAALEKIGDTENERALRNKVARGTFSAAFLLQALAAMGVENIDLTKATLPDD